MVKLGARRLEQAFELGQGLIAGLDDASVLIADAELRILAVEGYSYAALATTSLVGRRVPDVIPAGAWRLLEPHYTAAVEGQAQSFLYEGSSKPTTHQIHMAPIREGDEVIGLMVTAENVTERLRAPGRLADSVRLRKSVLDVLDEGILVVDQKGALLRANPAAVAMLGLDLDAARADPDWWHAYDLRAAEDGYPLDAGLIAEKTTQGDRNAGIEGRLPDGTRVLWSVNFQPMRGEDGRIDALVASFRDVTEQTRAHRELVDSQERLRAAYAVAQLSSWELDPASGEVTVYQALESQRALTGKKVVLDELLADMAPEEREAARADYDALVAGEQHETVRRSSYEHGGGRQWLETRMWAVRDSGGTLLGVRGTTQDVTEQEQAKQETAGARDFFQATLDSLSAHIAVLDGQGRVIMTNRAWVAFAAAGGCEPQDLGDDYLAVCDSALDEPGARRTAAGLRAIIAGEQTEFVEEYACHGPRNRAWFLLRAVRFDGPGSACVVVSHEDVTDRHQAQQQVATQAALLDEVDVAVVATDNAGRITRWNRGAEELYGWEFDEIAGRDGVELLTPPDAAAGREYVAELQRAGHHASELELRRKDGSTFRAAIHGRVMMDSQDRPVGVVNVTTDMSERVAGERALLAARNYMNAVADSMGEGMFTLDTAGRLIFMNAAAERLLGWQRDELQGRVMHDITPLLAAREDGLIVRVEDDHFVRRDGSELPVAYTRSPFETEEGIEGSVVVFDDISERKASEARLQSEADKLAWIARIQDALAEDRFVLYAQPIVDLASGEVVQSELLLRLRDPSGEIIAPLAFLGIAEEYGLIGEIDRWVVARGIDVAATGRPVQINLSARSVGDREILDHIEMCLRTSGADPGLVVFEITETAIVDDVDAARVFTERLHAVGCKLALDDFGTGYGGFTYLKQLPVDFLKIDIEFVRDLVSNPGSRHVVEAVVGLAGGFGLQTVAEGVEDADAAALLQELGVDLAQGYHFARPEPLEPDPIGEHA